MALVVGGLVLWLCALYMRTHPRPWTPLRPFYADSWVTPSDAGGCFQDAGCFVFSNTSILIAPPAGDVASILYSGDAILRDGGIRPLYGADVYDPPLRRPRVPLIIQNYGKKLAVVQREDDGGLTLFIERSAAVKHFDGGTFR